MVASEKSIEITRQNQHKGQNIVYNEEYAIRGEPPLIRLDVERKCIGLSLNQFTKEQLQEMSLIEMAYEMLNINNKQPLSFKEIVDAISAATGHTDEEIKSRIAQFYTDLNIDGRFISLGENRWGLRVWYPIDQIEDETVSSNVKTKKKKKAKKVVDEDEDLDIEEFDEEDEELDDTEDDFDDIDDLDDVDDEEEVEDLDDTDDDDFDEDDDDLLDDDEEFDELEEEDEDFDAEEDEDI